MGIEWVGVVELIAHPCLWKANSGRLARSVDYDPNVHTKRDKRKEKNKRKLGPMGIEPMQVCTYCFLRAAP